MRTNAKSIRKSIRRSGHVRITVFPCRVVSIDICLLPGEGGGLEALLARPSEGETMADGDVATPLLSARFTHNKRCSWRCRQVFHRTGQIYEIDSCFNRCSFCYDSGGSTKTHRKLTFVLSCMTAYFEP